MSRWKVRKWPKCVRTRIWDVFEPDGSWSGAFASWDEAMYWATSFASRVEHYLEVQTR